MACLQLLFRHGVDVIHLVPFASDPKKRGNFAAGRTLHLPLDEFVRNGARTIRDELERFYSRGMAEKSELYNLTPDTERRRILRSHHRLTLCHDRGEPTIVVYDEPHSERFTADVQDDSAIVRVILDCFAVEIGDDTPK